MNATPNLSAADKLSNNFSRLLVNLAKDFEQKALDKCHRRGHTDIRKSHASLFSNLGFGAVRLTELADRAGITQQAMGKLVKEMELLGYVKRHIDAADKRAKIIELTAKGNTLVNDSLDIIDEVISEYTAVIGNQGINELERVLSQSVTALGIGTTKTGAAKKP